MRIGIIGAGQLGQMLGFAARDLGLECRFLDPAESPPAAAAGEVVRAAFDDPEALEKMARDCDVITYEFENVPVAALAALHDTVAIYPPAAALSRAQDRLDEKRLFGELEIPVPPYRSVSSQSEFGDAIRDLGLPLVIKTRRLGYDGKGQFIISDASQADVVWQNLGGRKAIAEAWVPFDVEVSVIGVRNRLGEIAIWPLAHNEHRDGILRVSRAPFERDGINDLAARYVKRLLSHLDYVGVLALELFVIGDKLLANEYAPRVHNSGHWTIEGSETSQFTNHVLAITGKLLGPTDARGHSGMVNLIGTIPDAVRSIGAPQTILHDYGKKPRTGRKLGHVTVVAESASERDAALRKILETVN